MLRCHSKDHLIAKCPYDSDDEDAINKERKKQKKQVKEGSHKKKVDAHVAIWDSDDSSSDDDEHSKKKSAC